MPKEPTGEDLFKLFMLFEQKYEAEEFEAATNAINKLLELCPEWEHGNGWLDLSACYLERKDYRRALSACYKSLEFPGMEASVADNLTLALAGCGELEDALRVLKQSLESHLPLSPESVSSLIPALSGFLRELDPFWQIQDRSIYEELMRELPSAAELWSKCRESLV
ncbi:MAG: hypothetical protein IPP57_11775 [Candidatus Obscuribacter sp.]|jgi:tetratricopeptide (TPR) repeat protein|nr:hypothetical protein [Candidatus Obscuribacter sp.]MBK9621026.1 hypothetical protein [Candidatus Obscuribacter sp.]MBK9771487.1 hypothetical protein [Candidatus Obscuribacter sp.]